MPVFDEGVTPMQQPHFVIISVGSLGDLYPFLSLAKTLQRLGYKVTFFGVSVHAPIVQQAGIPFVGIGTDEEYLGRLQDPNLWHPVKGFQVFLRHYREHLLEGWRVFAEFPRDEQYVVVSHPFALPSADLFRVIHPQTKIVGVHLAPASLRTCYDPLLIGATPIPRWLPMGMRKILWWLTDVLLIDPVAVTEVNAARTACELPPIRHFMQHLTDVPDLTLLLFPAWFALPQADWGRVLYQGDFPLFEPDTTPVLAADLQAFLAAGDAPLVFTAGTAHCHAADYFRVAQQAVERLGRRAIFLTQYREQLPPSLPDSIHWQAYVPLQALLPHVAAVVHHGGIGTTAETLRAGVPQLIVPFAWDQFDNAARITALGVGDSIPANRLNAHRLTRKLAAILASTAMQQRCQIVTAEFAAAQSVEHICRELAARLFE